MKRQHTSIKPDPVGLIILILLGLLLCACSDGQKSTRGPVAATPTYSAQRTSTSVPAITTTTATQAIPSTHSVAPTVSSLSQDWQYRWLKGIPCQAPCWEGVTPGVTTADEGYALLQNSPDYFRNITKEVLSLQPDLGYIDWKWNNNLHVGKNGNNGGTIRYQANTPDQIIYKIVPYYFTTFNFSEIIPFYGEPSHVIATVVLNEDFSYSFELRYVYLTRGFQLESGILTKDKSNKPIIAPNTEMANLTFFAPGIDGFDAAQKQRKNLLVPWQGYKSFDFYCRDVYETGKEDCSGVLQARP
jgi:hypothetical protein